MDKSKMCKLQCKHKFQGQANASIVITEAKTEAKVEQNALPKAVVTASVSSSQSSFTIKLTALRNVPDRGEGQYKVLRGRRHKSTRGQPENKYRGIGMFDKISYYWLALHQTSKEVWASQVPRTIGGNHECQNLIHHHDCNRSRFHFITLPI